MKTSKRHAITPSSFGRSPHGDGNACRFSRSYA